MRKIKAVSYFLILLSLFGQPFALVAAEYQGQILNSETNQPVTDVMIRIKGDSRKEFTDSKGIFLLSDFKAGDYLLEFSSLGYRTMHQAIVIKKHDKSVHVFKMFAYAVEKPAVLVTGNTYTSKFEEMYERTNTLDGRDLEKEMGATLSSTLKNETGIAVRSMGPAPARPVIRGLGGNRVQITEDGMEVKDLSASSPDHAVTVEPFTVERIEVERGPKILLSTPSTIGGIVNIIRKEIPIAMPEKVHAEAGLFGESANDSYLGSFGAEVPVNPFILKGDVSHKKSGNMSTPLGVLKNTSFENNNYSLGSAFVKDSFITGVSFSEFMSDYGVPGGFIGGHPNGVNIDLYKRVMNAKSIYHIDGSIIDNVEADFNRTYYHHTEYETANIVGAEFVSTDYTGELTLNQNKFGIFNDGSFAVSYNHKQMDMGGYVFTPPTSSFNMASAIYENFNIKPFLMQAAARFDYSQFNPQTGNPVSSIGLIRDRDFATFSIAFSGMYELMANHFIGLNLSRTSRPPSIEELYSEGPHLAAYSYETGNPSLSSEYGYAGELFFYHKNDEAFMMLSGFLYELPSYILPRNTGKINYQMLLPIYATTNENVRMLGFEYQGDFKLSKHLDFSSSISYTKGIILSDNSPMPMIPPLKLLLDLKYSNRQFSAGARSEMAAAQNRVDRFEQPTAGYIIFGAYMQFSFAWLGLTNNLSISGDNLTNRVYYNHLSRIKSIMPEPGRSIRLIYKVYY